jgi:hypothetical protein
VDRRYASLLSPATKTSLQTPTLRWTPRRVAGDGGPWLADTGQRAARQAICTWTNREFSALALR